MKNLPFRGWFYFRTGYATYIALLLGVVNVLTTTYHLAIKNIPILEKIFPDFATYIYTIIGIGVPITVLVGYVHFKKSPSFSTETDISVEANPYYYKLPPGFWKEVFGPVYLQTLRLCTKIANNEKITDDERKKIKELEDKMDRLVKGESIGK